MEAPPHGLAEGVRKMVLHPVMDYNLFAPSERRASTRNGNSAAEG